MSKVQAILTSNNAYDTVLLANGTAMMVTGAVFADLVSDALEIGNWDGSEDWSEHGDNLATAAVAYGDVVAQVVDGQLVIVDADKFAERKAFYLESSRSKKFEIEVIIATNGGYAINRAWVDGEIVLDQNSPEVLKLVVENGILKDIEYVGSSFEYQLEPFTPVAVADGAIVEIDGGVFK